MRFSKMTPTILAIMCVLFSGCTSKAPGENVDKQVIIYVAHDQDYSEPILKDFEKKTGIKVKPIYDTETTKTVGLVNKIIAEKSNPQADVFWNNEVSRTMKLKQEGILAPYVSLNSKDKPDNMKDPNGYWTGFGARARVILYNTNLVKEEDAPKSITDFTKPFWKGKFCLANPLYGSTGSHVSSLFAIWGEDKAKEFFSDLKANEMAIVESNGMVRDQVVSGQYLAGITDTDDAYDAVSEGKPVNMVFPDKHGFGTLFFPNSVMLIKDGPNPENGKKLIDYLLSKEVEGKLAQSKAMQIPLGKRVPKPEHVPDIEEVSAMKVTQEQISANLEASQRYVQQTLLK